MINDMQGVEEYPSDSNKQPPEGNGRSDDGENPISEDKQSLDQACNSSAFPRISVFKKKNQRYKRNLRWIRGFPAFSKKKIASVKMTSKIKETIS